MCGSVVEAMQPQAGVWVPALIGFALDELKVLQLLQLLKWQANFGATGAVAILNLTATL
jgi:hypothetical protein